MGQSINKTHLLKIWYMGNKCSGENKEEERKLTRGVSHREADVWAEVTRGSREVSLRQRQQQSEA